MTEPRGGWASLALSVGGLLAFVVGLGYVWAAFNTSSGGDLGFAFMGLILAPCLSVAGWVVGNRNASRPAGTRSTFWEGGDPPSHTGKQYDDAGDGVGHKASGNSSPLVDGRAVGRAVLILTLLPGLAALGIWIFVGHALSSVQIP